MKNDQDPKTWCAFRRAARSRVMVCAVGLAVAACDRGGPKSFERPPAPVTVVAAVKQDVPVYLDEIGKCAAREMVSIQPQVSGRITDIHFADGADLKAGDLLFTIDPRPFQAQLDSAGATVTQRVAGQDWARIEYERYADLVKTNAVSQSDYELKKNALDVADAMVKQAQAALETAKLNLDYCTIRSPIDGRAGQRLVDLGNVVEANKGSLLVIQRLDPIYADFTVAENDLTAVQENMKSGTLKAEVRLPDGSAPDSPAEMPRVGDLTFLDNAVQSETGTVRLRATIENKDYRFWPGRFVKIRLILKTIPGAILIPAAAPQMSAQGQFVYVIKSDDTAELRIVKLGQRQGNMIVIDHGLSDGERVVTNGQMGVMPGAKVRIEERVASSNARESTPGKGS